ncbi:potassium/proton antiporter [Clostridium paraputrificum]|uniref:potassium/proton antiporter n=1 Tax=Clostridium TaxID=1485 RepID=UPI00232E5D6A|nr:MULTISPECIES: potassium/proton antiporter [Clostridium]MDB2104279.1 potassium/proton antiporter [Clostridium paraputrificum]MDU4144478.1 potassium/proton antiporter [Clostridium sp.]
MVELMIISGLVLLICITSSKMLYKFGVPMLLIFIVLGMLFGSDGIVGIYFDNYDLTSKLCSIALVFIMFYGGFGTNWKMAKPVANQSILMSTFGVIITSLLTGVFCYFILNTSLLEGLLIGSIVGSTDAASVFTILRSQKLNLKSEIASLLEVESGSNDPIAYMMTLSIIMIMSSGLSWSIVPMILKQVIFGILLGVVLAKATVFIIRRANFELEGFYSIFIIAIAILAYALSEFIGGNGYLSVYISGIILGNSKIPHKKSLVVFFDGISWIMQIMLFFMLGLLSFPSRLPEVIGVSIIISIFMIFIARPIATHFILMGFKTPIKEQILISWVGLRGAASIVFAIFAITSGVPIENDIFHIIFFIALISVSVQGTLLPKVAQKLDLVDNDTTVLKTFNDYQEDKSTMLLEYNVSRSSKWMNKTIMDAEIPDDILIVMIKRNGQVIVPKGSTEILENDILVLSGNNLNEVALGK